MTTAARTADENQLQQRIESLLRSGETAEASDTVASLDGRAALSLLARLESEHAALAYRLLHKDIASEVFERLDPPVQSDLLRTLRDEQVTDVFAAMDPDDRVELLDELPASVATRLLRGLPREERELTSLVLGYAQGSIGRRMSPEYVSLHPETGIPEALDLVRRGLPDAETVYVLPVVDDERVLVGG